MGSATVQLVRDDAGTFSRHGQPERVHVIRGEVPRGLRAPGPVLLAAGARIMGDVDARGAVHIARGATVAGHVRAVGEVIVGAHARVAAGIRAEGRAVVQTHAVVTGLLDAAMDVHLMPYARVERIHAGGDVHVARPVAAGKVRATGRVFYL